LFAENGEASNKLLRDWPPITVSTIEVVKKIAASTPVIFAKTFAPPELPNTVWLEPPNDALISAPFPD
jgi:hypothetical protein